ncbi:MAG: hypothetical protein Q8S33_03790 [Myxococcales bacterium]|nr:hypothetical protein [Myxococcales bacterium]
MAPLSRLVALVGLVTSSTALAHFYLEAPLNAYSQNSLGDPQKNPPCGNVASTPATNVVTTFEAGQTITVRIRETIFHPGHYRVAVGVTGPQSLPPVPAVTPGATNCGSTTIQNPAVFPVLADGMLLHTRAFTGPQSFQVTLPANLRCTNCTLQVYQFMSSHGGNNPGGCFYSHCANINVVAPDAGVMPMDAGMTGGGSAGGGTAGGTAGTGGGTASTGGGTSGTGGGTASTGGGTSGTAGGTSSMAGGTSGTAGGASGITLDGGVDPGPVGGCGCTGGAGSVLLAGLVLLAGAFRRRQYR